MIKRLPYKPICVLLAAILLMRFCEKQTKGFRYYEICSNLPDNPDWELTTDTTPLDPKIYSLLSQTFSYHAKGEQSYVFLGEDGSTILKFFKHDHLSLHKLAAQIPIFSPFVEFIIKKIGIKQRILDHVLMSAKIAFENLQEETGLFYVHINKKTDYSLPSITVKDPIGVTHKVSLQDTEFVLQKRVSLFFPSVKQYLIENETAMVKKEIRKYMQYISKRCDKGIRNTDYSSYKNVGLLGDHVVELDIGSYVQDLNMTDEVAKKIELMGHTRKIKAWLRYYQPDLLTFYESQIHYWSVTASTPPIFMPAQGTSSKAL